MVVKVQWDERKRRVNIDTHHFDFVDAAELFTNGTLRVFAAHGNDTEIRHKGMGILYGVVLVVVYTLRNETVRLISVRKASRSERKKYGE